MILIILLYCRNGNKVLGLAVKDVIDYRMLNTLMFKF